MRGDLALYIYVASVAAAVLVLLAVLLRKRSALVLRGIAENEKRMQANGYNPHRHLWAAYVVIAVVVDVGGSVISGYGPVLLGLLLLGTATLAPLDAARDRAAPRG